MKHSESMSNIAPALLEVQKKLEAVPKDDKKNNFGKRYTNLGTILRVAKEHLNENGMVILQGGEGSTLTGHLNIETTILHVSGEYISGVFSVPYGDMTPQKAGSAITYARRYSAASLLGMVSEEDDDGEASSSSPAEEVRPPVGNRPKANPAPKPKPKAAPKPAPKPTEARSSADLKEGAVKSIKACMESRKNSPNDAVSIDMRVEKTVEYSRTMKEKGLMTDTDFRNVQDLSKVYFDA
tara:strand:+ start:2504 stop:3220 length:717 start_codon:yes stop_codon:yes gene_type:complete